MFVLFWLLFVGANGVYREDQESIQACRARLESVMI